MIYLRNIFKRKKIALAGFSNWKSWMNDYFPQYELIFLGHGKTFNKNLLDQFKKGKPSEIWVWSYKCPSFLFEYANNNNIPIKFIEDGFIRGLGLGINKSAPLSLAIDTRAMHFDRENISDLENMIYTFDPNKEIKILNKSELVLKSFRNNNISKYMFPSTKQIQYTKKGILVLGQVEDDLSIIYGMKEKLSSNDLVKIAKDENPNCTIYYRPHPESIASPKEHYSKPEDVSNICNIIDPSTPLNQCFDLATKVYTFTSLSGFEAIIHDIPVKCFGNPFYSGWGLTEDTNPLPRRDRTKTLLEVFACAYVLYPSYFVQNKKSNIDDTLKFINNTL